MKQITFKKAGLYPYLYNTKGHLSDKYGPFQNLYTTEMDTFTTTKLNFDLEHPVDILVQDAYDGAVNLILNDGKNMPRLINSRFSVLDNDTFLIPNHSGIKDTNIYDDSTFDIDTALKTIPLSIPKVEFLGLLNNTGNMPCGSYSFYFKLADADGNETEIMAESGVVQCHIGEDGKPNTIRMGMQDENSLNAISFKLSNIDTGLNYVHVYYCRHSSSNALSTSTTYHKINFDYSVNKNGECSILITGNEDIQTAKKEEFYVNYADIDSTKTQELYNNVLFFGNNETQEHDWDMLKRMSWKIIPTIEHSEISDLGDISGSTYETTNKGLYYHSLNIYYNVGYWPDEFYRFGIVYIFNDNSLSPVFNILGVAMEKSKTYSIEDFLQPARGELLNEYLYAPENFIFKNEGFYNSKGVLRLPNDPDYYHSAKFDSKLTHTPVRIKFDMSYIHVKSKNENGKFDLYYGSKNDIAIELLKDLNEWYLHLQKFLQYHKIKGFFFVRQKRIPTILCLGLAISLLNKECGAVPVLEKINYFLQEGKVYGDNDNISRMLSSNVSDLTRNPSKLLASTRALLIPDAALNEATYNLIFISNTFSLEPIRNLLFHYLTREEQIKEPYKCCLKKIKSSSSSRSLTSKLTNIPDGAPLLTDGENYFAAQVGSASDPILVKNTDGDWTRTMRPQDATKSTNYIRGLWGSYVGSSTELRKNYLYNIRPLSHLTLTRELFNQQEFAKRFIDQNDYHAICDRTSFFTEDGVTTEIICARGDCFSNLFTHRIQRNFIDPELPTNTEIIDPKCWGKNFAVRATAKVPANNTGSNYSNCSKADEGWVDETEGTTYYNQVAQTFVLNTGTGSNTESYSNYLCDKSGDSKYHYYEWKNGTWNYLGYLGLEADMSKEGFPKGETFSSDETQRPIAWNRDCLPHDYECKGIYLKEPEIIKTGMGLIDITAALADSLVNSYVERSVTKINRADLNAVPIGLWITFPVYSNYNYAMRDIDHYSVTEEATFNEKRSFYPLRECNPHSPLRDSGIINSAAAISIPDKGYQLLPDAPFYKQEYFTRITNSLFDDAGTFSNELKVILEECYKDFTKIYGSITRITALNDHLYVIFKHGIGIINVTDLMVKNPDQPKEWLTNQLLVLSDQFGSLWKDSIINTGKYIYGVDSVAKIIWRINGTIVENISDITKGKVGKWLVDNIDMSEFTIYPYVGHINIKTHYNNNKHDVIFTYYNDIPESYDWKALEEKLNTLGYYFPSDEAHPAESLIVKWNPLILDYTLNTDYFTYNAVTREVIDLRTNMSVCAMPPVKKWKLGTRWALNFNEDVEVFTTFQDWYPLESENIDNIYFSFDRDKAVEIMDSVYSSETNIKILHPNTYLYELGDTSILEGIDFIENIGTKILSEKSLCYKINKHNVDNSCFYKSTLFFCDEAYEIKKVKFKFNNPIQNNKLYAFCFYIRTLSKSQGPTTLCLHCKDRNDPNIINWKTSFEVSDSWQFVTLFYTNNSTSPRYKEDGIVFEIYPENSDFLNIEYCEPKIMDCDYENNLMYENIYDDLKNLEASDFDLCRSDYQIYNGELNAKSYENSKHVLKYYFPRPSEENGNLPLIQDKDYLDLRDSLINMKIWKHGQAGVYDNAGKIKPTNWYGKQHEFNFEFVVKDNPANLKIFNNLLIISNKTAPDKFEFEVVGESYEIQKYKPLLQWCAEKIKFYESDPEHNAAVWINVGGKGDYIRNPETKNFEYRPNLGDYTKVITYSTKPDKTADNYNLLSNDYIKNPFSGEFENVGSKKGNYYEIWNYEYVGYNGEYIEEISYELDNKGKYKYNGLKAGAAWVESDLLTDVNDRYKQVYIHEYKGPHGGPYINKAQEYLYKYLLSTPVYKLKETYTDFPDVSFIQPDVNKCIQQLPKIDTVLSDKKGLSANDKTYTKNHKWKEIESKLKGQNDFTFNCGETVIVEDEQLNEYRLRTEQLGNDINKYDRVRGNQLYLEDIWRIEIRPINFKFVYLLKNEQGGFAEENGEFKLIETETFEARLRDKFIKIKVRYSGENLAIINNILTLYERSYA